MVGWDNICSSLQVLLVQRFKDVCGLRCCFARLSFLLYKKLLIVVVVCELFLLLLSNEYSTGTGAGTVSQHNTVGS